MSTVIRSVIILVCVVLVGYLLMAPSAHASVNTLRLIDSYPDGSDTVCVFSNGRRTETWVKNGAGSCPSHMTFGSDEEEDE